MSFDPKPHLIQLPKRVKDKKTNKWINSEEDYLEVKWRIVWFRDRYPHGTIDTQEIEVDLNRIMTIEVPGEWVDDKRQTITKTGTGYARFRTRVEDGEGGVATGYGTESAVEFADFVERAETRSIGRALGHLGIGTQFIGQDMSEGSHIVDSPGTSQERLTPQAEPSTNGRMPTGKPTREEVAAILTALREVCSSEADVQTLVRAVLKMPETAPWKDSLLHSMMTRTHLNALHAEVADMVRSQGERIDSDDHSESLDADTTQAAVPPTETSEAPESPDSLNRAASNLEATRQVYEDAVHQAVTERRLPKASRLQTPTTAQWQDWERRAGALGLSAKTMATWRHGDYFDALDHIEALERETPTASA